MRFLVFLVVAVALLSCAPQRGGVVPGKAEVILPPAAKPVRVEPAREAAAGAEREGAAAQANVVSLTKEAFSLRSDLGKAIAEADRLRKAETRSKDEIAALWQQLTTIQASHQKVVDDAEAAKAALDRQAAFERQLRDEHDKLSGDLELAQAERDKLRSAAERLQDDYSRTYDALGEANKIANQRASKADRLAGEITIYRIVLACVVGFFLLKGILRIYKP